MHQQPHQRSILSVHQGIKSGQVTVCTFQRCDGLEHQQLLYHETLTPQGCQVERVELLVVRVERDSLIDNVMLVGG